MELQESEHYQGDELWEKIVSRQGGCWIWGGTINTSKGYATFRTPDGKERDARLVVWERCKGEVPDKHVIERTCNNELCVSPYHHTLRPREIKNRTFLYKKDSRTKGDCERFWEKVEKGEPNECWLWKGATLNTGYGVFQVSIHSVVKTSTVHRVAYQFAIGDIPEGRIVSHSCGTKLCVNPQHLTTLATNGAPRKKKKAIDPSLTFWNQVERFGENDCWNWKGRNKKTFSWKDENGQIRFMIPAKCALFFSGTDITKETKVLHSCGAPYCCNPKHIRLSTDVSWREIEASISKQENGCWIWRGEVTAIGQPCWATKNNSPLATLYREHHGPLPTIGPKGHWIIPSCGNLRCVSPDHLICLPFQEAKNTLARFRFWLSVEKTETCWIWKGSRTYGNYGQYSAQRKTYQAHRYSYLITHGNIPDGKIVCHSCGNSLCVRPDHLYAGTNKENSADMVRHGTQRSHSYSPMLPLTSQHQIRRRLKKFIHVLALEFDTNSKFIKSLLKDI